MRRLVATALAGLLAAGAGACGDGTVRVDYRPEAGARHRYEVRVRTERTTSLAGAEPERSVEDVTLLAEHTVLAAGPDGTRVQVVLVEPEGDQRTFVVVFDRAAQLAAIESIEGVPAEVLGELGLTELFPAAGGGPPDRPLAPGDRWVVDAAVDLGEGVEAGRLSGGGRLVSLGRAGGADVARLRSETAVPVATSRTDAGGTVRLQGEQRTVLDAARRLDDGAVETARATTTGSYDLVVEPPAGTAAPPARGRLDVVVTSETRRVEVG